MFDPLPERRQAYERYLLDLAEAGELDDDWDDPEELYYLREIYDDEPPFARMARLAVDIEAGRGGAAPLEARAAESRDPALDHPFGAALRMRPERRAAAAAMTASLSPA